MSLLMKDYQSVRLKNCQSLVDVEIFMRFGYQLLKKPMQRFMAAMKI